MDIESHEEQPGRQRVTVTDDAGSRRHTVLIPAGVGVPGASDEALAETVVEVLYDLVGEAPASLDVTSVLRAHPQVWSEVERRLDG